MDAQVVSLIIVWLHHPILNSSVLVTNLAETSVDKFNLIFVEDINYIFGENFSSK